MPSSCPTHTPSIADYYGDDTGISVAFDGAGNVYAAGAGWDGPEFGNEAFLAQYDPNGAPMFAGRYDGPVHGDDEAFSVVVHADGVHIAGLSQHGSQHLDLVAVKYGPESGFASASMQPLSLDDDPLQARVQTPPEASRWVPRAPRSPFPYRPRSHRGFATIGQAGGR